MAWNDRLREAAYTSPLGKRTLLTYENVSEEVEKRTSGFDFPDASGTYVQDLGYSGRKYPLRLFFWGDDYDLEAQAFIDTLLETGPGTLEHPIYGRVLVVPFGAITRRDDLKTRANQAVIELTFWETIPEIYPLAQGDAASEAEEALEDFNAAASAQFAQDIDLSSASLKSTFLARYDAVKNTVTAGLASIAAATNEVNQRFNTINQSINSGIDLLVGEPLTLAFQTMALIQAPANASTLIQARLDGYSNLLDMILNGGVATPGNDAEPANTFKTADLYGAGYVSGQAVAVLNNEFETKTEAIAAAEFILTQFAEWVEWHDANYSSLGEIDTGETYQALQRAVAVTAAFLVDISFTLKQERAFILQDPRGVLDLVAELYGNVDEFLDFFIRTNNLTGSEILELPAGKTIVYYV